MKRQTFYLIGLAILTSGLQAHADSPDTRHWIARIGVHPIDPKPNSHPEYRVDNAVAVSLGATYLFTKHWGLELFGAAPAEHDVRDLAGERVGTFDLLPLATTMQYHVSDARDRIRAYAGAGVAYAAIRNEKTMGSLATSRVQLDRSIGLTAAIGLDMNMGSRWFVNIDARWFDIDADMKVDGQQRGRLELDPYALGLSIGRRLR
jgi:outer membrane protein